MKKSKRFWTSLVLFGLVGQVAWVVENMYFNVFIYKMFAASATQISLMVALSSVVATLTTLLIGALSDKIGRRKIFIAGGYILWGVSILGFALVRADIIGAMLPASASVSAVCITIAIILDCVMTFFGSTANDACFNAWLTDSTTDTGRGKVEGINAMMPLMAILVVFGGFMSFDLGKASSWTVIFIVIGVLVIALGVAGLFLIEETPVRHDENQNYFKNILYGFRPSTVRNNIVFYVTILAFSIFGISIQIFMPYLIIYYEVSLAMDNYVLIMAPAILIAGGVTAVYGRYYDKAGFTASILPAFACLAAGYAVLAAFQGTILVFVGSLLMMTGYLAGMAVFGAMIRDYTPSGKAGALQGIRIVGQVLIPGVFGPMIGAAVLSNADVIIGNDGTKSFVPNHNIFIAALVALVFCAAVTMSVRAFVKYAKEVSARTTEENPADAEDAIVDSANEKDWSEDRDGEKGE